MKISTNSHTDCISRTDFILYKKNLLEDAQRFEFENHLLGCQLCSNAFDGFSDMDMPVLKHSFDNIDAKFEALMSKTDTKLKIVKPKKFNYSIVRKIAAVVFGVVILAFAINKYSNQNSGSNLFSQNFDSYQIDDFTERSKKQSLSIYQKGIHAFNNKDYEYAFDLIVQSLEEQSVNKFDRILSAGITALMMDRYEIAYDYLMKVRMNDTLQQEKATWYLALVFVKKEENEKAVTFLNEIIQLNGHYKEKATALIKDLE